MLSFVTHRGIYSPIMMPMGATDAVAYCQCVVEAIFRYLLGKGLFYWLDGILGYAETEEELLVLLEKVLERCENFCLKLHAKKCLFFATEVKRCGRIISAEGVKHYPEHIQGLVDMQPPRTAGELQQFVFAANWMRQSIPEYSHLSAALYEALERGVAKSETNWRKCVGWHDAESASFGAVRAAVAERDQRNC
ncbi:unnamed protein product [Phytophthora fragariaefolia]|uniref:Unnamed protein product n=1 Tax=Phytophthora fragariaefolia TaxID=1490495 RepID=A0A9W6YED4_9STRA|nr:unnamed protein product [Phytophthora fragariaefolia]